MHAEASSHLSIGGWLRFASLALLLWSGACIAIELPTAGTTGGYTNTQDQTVTINPPPPSPSPSPTPTPSPTPAR